MRNVSLSALAAAVLVVFLVTTISGGNEGPIYWERARELLQKQRQGASLTQEEREYLERARRERQRHSGRRGESGRVKRGDSIGLTPITQMGEGLYKGQTGGLYGGGMDIPPEAHQKAVAKELANIRPLDADGRPSTGGKIVLMAIGMSNTKMEFSAFTDLAGRDPNKSSNVVLVNAAIGGMDVIAWAKSRATQWGTAWEGAERRLKEAGVTAAQVQVVWLKQAKMGPAGWGKFPAHARKLADGMAVILNMAKERYPNLRVAYLSSRIYAGYATTPLNPEPYAYESAFSVRWLIEEQIKGEPNLNYDAQKGQVKSPLLLWGPYLWADGVEPRKADGLVWKRQDLAGDGTHPSKSGRRKVAEMLLKFFKTDPNAHGWFLKKPV